MPQAAGAELQPISNPELPGHGTIALASLQSSRNLGDTAILRAAIDAIRIRRPSCRLVRVAPEPDCATTGVDAGFFPFHGDDAHRGRRFGQLDWLLGRIWRLPRTVRAVRRVLRFVGTIDALVFAGGGLVDDYWGGVAEVPFWVSVWTACARLRRVPVSFIGIGVDRGSSRMSRWLFARALAGADFLAVRDDGSRRLLRDWGMRAPCTVCPDLSFGLRLPATDPRSDTSTPRVVIVNPVSHRMWNGHPDSPYERYIDTLSELCRHLLAARSSEVQLLSTQYAMDRHAIEAINARLFCSESGVVVIDVHDLDAYVDVVRHAEFVISSRLHGLILPLVASVPVVAIAPMRKMHQLMQDMSLNDFCVPLPEADLTHLLALVDRITQTQGPLRAQITKRVSQLRIELETLYDALALDGLLGAPAEEAQAAPGQAH